MPFNRIPECQREPGFAPIYSHVWNLCSAKAGSPTMAPHSAFLPDNFNTCCPADLSRDCFSPKRSGWSRSPQAPGVPTLPSSRSLKSVLVPHTERRRQAASSGPHWPPHHAPVGDQAHYRGSHLLRRHALSGPGAQPGLCDQLKSPRCHPVSVKATTSAPSRDQRGDGQTCRPALSHSPPQPRGPQIHPRQGSDMSSPSRSPCLPRLSCVPSSMDLSEALSLPGVVDIVTAEHLGDANSFAKETLLATDKVVRCCFLLEK